MNDLFSYLREAVGGPGHLRFILQPLIAIILGARDGLHDARLGKPPYGLELLTARCRRKGLFREGLARVMMPLCAGVAIDIVLRFSLGYGFAPFSSLAVGVSLIGIPYIAARGISNRGTAGRIG